MEQDAKRRLSDAEYAALVDIGAIEMIGETPYLREPDLEKLSVHVARTILKATDFPEA